MHAVLDRVCGDSVSKQSCATSSFPPSGASASSGGQGTLAISQEHFASNLIRGRLLSRLRPALGPRQRAARAARLRAGASKHDITLLAFGLLLRSYGWRIPLLWSRHTDLDIDTDCEDDPTDDRCARQLRPGTAASGSDCTSPPRKAGATPSSADPAHQTHSATSSTYDGSTATSSPPQTRLLAAPTAERRRRGRVPLSVSATTPRACPASPAGRRTRVSDTDARSDLARCTRISSHAWLGRAQERQPHRML